MSNDNVEKRVAKIRLVLEERETEDLLRIWKENDREEWTDEAFMAIQLILTDRLGNVPSQTLWSQSEDVLDPSYLAAEAMQHLKQVEKYLDKGKFDKALRECDQALELAPNLAAAHNYRGLVYDEMGQTEDAIAAYLEAVRLDPNYEEAQANLRDSKIELEVENQLTPAKRHLTLAVEYVNEGELEKALEECDTAIQILPRLSPAHNFRGMIYEEMEQFENAIENYLEAVRLAPEFEAARANLCGARLKWQNEQYRRLAQDMEMEIQEDTTQFSDEEDADIDLDEYQDVESDGFDLDGYLQPAYYLDDKAFILQGWPGHRIRPGHSGYDPLDTYFEQAHMQGVMLRLLFTKKFRTRNPIYLVIMGVFGLLASLPLLLGLASMDNINLITILMLILFSPYWIVGLALLRNVYWSVSISNEELVENQDLAFF